MEHLAAGDTAPVEPHGCRVAVAETPDIGELSRVAERTFPLACPPSATPEDIRAFVQANLSADRFAEYLADPDRVVLVARAGSDGSGESRIVGYAMLIHGAGNFDDHDADVHAAVALRPAVELSKLYVVPDAHSAGISPALIRAALHLARQHDAACLWLGVNPGKPTRAALLRQTRVHRHRHQNTSARHPPRARLRDGQCAQLTPRSNPALVSASSREVARRYFLRYPPASISALKMLSSFDPDATTGMPAS